MRLSKLWIGLLAALAFAASLLGTVLWALLVGPEQGKFRQLGALSFRTTLRNARAQAIITDAGASAKLKLYNGTRPSGVSAVTGGNTLLASGAFGTTIGSVVGSALDFDEAGFTQTPAGFTAGTPTFAVPTFAVLKTFLPFLGQSLFLKEI